MFPSSFKQKLEEGWEAFASQVQGVQLFPMTVTKKSNFHEIGPHPIPVCIDFNNNVVKSDKVRVEEEDEIQEAPFVHEIPIKKSSASERSRTQSSQSSEQEDNSQPQTPKRSGTPTPVMSQSPRTPSKIPSPLGTSSNEDKIRHVPSSIIAAPMAVKVNPSFIFISPNKRENNNSFSSHSCVEAKSLHEQMEMIRRPKVPSGFLGNESKPGFISQEPSASPGPVTHKSKPEFISQASQERSVFPDERFGNGVFCPVDKSRDNQTSSRNPMGHDRRISNSGSRKAQEDKINGNYILESSDSRNVPQRKRSVDNVKNGSRSLTGNSHGRLTGGNSGSDKLSKTLWRGSSSHSNMSLIEKSSRRSLEGKRSVPSVCKLDTDDDLTTRLQELINRRGKHQVRSTHELKESVVARRRSSDLLRNFSSNGRVRRMNSNNTMSDMHSKSAPRFTSKCQDPQVDQQSIKGQSNIGIWKSSELLYSAYRNVLEIRGEGVEDSGYPEASASQPGNGTPHDATSIQLGDVVKRLGSLEETVADLARSHKSQSQKLQDIVNLMGKQDSRHDLTMTRLEDVTALVSTALEEIKDIKILEAQVLKLTSCHANESYHRSHVQSRCSNTNYKKVTFKGINDR